MSNELREERVQEVIGIFNEMDRINVQRREHKVSSEAFIEIGGDYILVDAITRLSTTDVVGSPGVAQHFARLSDGANIPLSEKD